MNKIVLFFSTLCISYTALGQSQTKRALFLGNSYTGVNNLPQMIANVASSTGDTLIYDANTPGGYTLQGHSTNTSSLSKIAVGNWDYVVLQEQSQYPSFPSAQVEISVFPYAHKLDSIINAQNPCVETVFYMTWGRKNGDASNCATWPPVCTYAGMDSLLNLRYRMMADSNNAVLSPVGMVWKYLRQIHPSIDLYQTDESHPSVAGSYAAACTFYTTIFRKDPTLITFNSTLSASVAANIRAAAKLIVYDSLMNWHIGAYDPVANFSYSVEDGNHVTFTNSSADAETYSWSFGDGNSSAGNHPSHTYTESGSYTVRLIANKCGMSDTSYQTINISTLGVEEEIDKNWFVIYPNPATSILNVKQPVFSNKISYTIVNISGQIIKVGNLLSAESEINISPLTDGIYFIYLFDIEKSLGGQKFVKIVQ